MKLAKPQINSIKTYFKKQPVLKAYLFGSQARGEATPQSDVDILVELDYSQHIGLRFVRMQLELEELLGKSVDLVSTKGVSKYILSKIETEKQLIYAR